MKLLLNTVQLVLIIVWGITCYYICRSDEGFQYFIYWLLVGFPFGFHKMSIFLIPKGFSLAGELGVLALDAIVAGLFGGIFLVIKVIKIMACYIKAVMGLFVKRIA